MVHPKKSKQNKMALIRKDFLVKLREILDENNNSSLRWSPTQSCTFKIENPHSFSKEFLAPHRQYFPNIPSYQSFVTQLESYGFEKVGEFEFRHPQFYTTPVGGYTSSPALDTLTEADSSGKLHDINENQAAMMNQIETMYHDMEEMSRALTYLKQQSIQFDQLVRDYNTRSNRRAQLYNIPPLQQNSQRNTTSDMHTGRDVQHRPDAWPPHHPGAPSSTQSQFGAPGPNIAPAWG